MQTFILLARLFISDTFVAGAGERVLIPGRVGLFGKVTLGDSWAALPAQEKVDK